MLKPGDDVDSCCGTCKLILAHTIEALVDDTPARVHCNTCQAQHRYRPDEPGKAPKTVRQRKGAASDGPQTRKARASQYEKLLKGQDLSLAKRYSPTDSYALGDVVDHARFGVGLTTIKAGNKIEVVFEDGVKTLVHER